MIRKFISKKTFICVKFLIVAVIFFLISGMSYGLVSLNDIAAKLIFQEFVGVFNMLERRPLSTLFAKLLFSSSRFPFFS